MWVLDAVEMKPWAVYLPEVLIVTHGAPPDMAESYIRQAAIDFATRSQVLLRDLRLDVQAGVDYYPIRLARNERLVSLQWMGHEHGHCDCQVRRHCGTWVRGLASSAAFERDGIQITPLPRVDREGALQLRVAVRPARDACEADALLYEKYHEDIVNGALARLLLLKGMPWYDAALATATRQEFDRGIAAAGLDRLTGGQRGPMRMKTRRIV